jgi:heterodisulfide reductase subunit A
MLLYRFAINIPVRIRDNRRFSERFLSIDLIGWVTSDPNKATPKAKDIVKVAVARARWLYPQDEEQIPIRDAALVVGGGVAGMQAALDLADAGHQVYLVEKKPSIGGIMAQLDKVYPDIECSI